MIAEAIASLKELADKAGAVKSVTTSTVAQEPRDVYFVTDEAGKWERHIAEPHPRNYRANNVEDLCRMALHFQTVKPITLFCSRSGVFGIMGEDGDRRDRIRCELKLSDPMKTLMHLEANDIQADQRQFLNMLRVQLAVGAQSTPPNLVQRVRALKFSSSGNGVSVIANAGDSFGKTVQAQVLGMDGQEFPDTVHISVYPLEGVRFNVCVECAFDIDSASQKFRLKPLAGECEEAIRAAEYFLVNDVTGRCDLSEDGKIRIKVLGGSVS
jgi:hypothetical protein